MSSFSFKKLDKKQTSNNKIMHETNRIEYKRELTDDLEKEVVAFLNYREGGFIFIGIDTNGKVVGIANSDKLQLKIKDRIKNNILPSCMGLFDVVAEEKEGKGIIKIIVASGSEKPYYIKISKEKITNTDGIIKLDLSNYNLKVKGKFLVTLETVKTYSEPDGFYFCDGIFSTSPTFSRETSFGIWDKGIFNIAVYSTVQYEK